MSRSLGWLIVSALTLSCSPSGNSTKLEKWSMYQDPVNMRGLQLKPISVKYGTGGIYVNGKKMDYSSAIKLLRRSRDLSPSPDILAIIEESSYEEAVPFLMAISNEGLCEDQKCQLRIVKSKFQ